MSGPEDGARERVAAELNAHRFDFWQVPASGGWEARCTCKGWREPITKATGAADGSRARWQLHAADELMSVVADTTAGEALPVCPDCPSVGSRCAICPRTGLSPLAARSGGAQDNGLRARVEALAEECAFLGATLHNVPVAETFAEVATDLRRALAGPDDARQDGAG